MSKRLQDKVSVICGATAGIGMAMAELFAREGGKVIFTGRRLEKGLAIEADIKEKYEDVEIEFVQADSTKKEDLERVVNHTIEKYGRIDVLCNNPGYLMDATPTHEITADIYDTTFDLNVKSMFAMNTLVIPHMLKEGKGSIVNTASVGADQPIPAYAAYAASKAAVKHLTRSMGKEYASQGIRVNCIQPGLTSSEMVVEAGPFESAVLPNVPMGRTADPMEIAYGALFLASDESSYCAGTCLLIDGGLL